MDLHCPEPPPHQAPSRPAAQGDRSPSGVARCAYGCQCRCGRYGSALWGRHLRHAALAVLIDAGGARCVGEVLDELRRRGHGVGSTQPAGKAVAEGLAREVRLGRAARVRRGVYAIGRIRPSARRRILARFGPRCPGPGPDTAIRGAGG